MINLPKKYSVKWIYILIALFLLTFISMILVNTILALSLGMENLGGFAMLSLAVSVSIGIGGIVGAKVYFKIALIANFLGILYMLSASIFRTAEGWSDLVSIISYLLVLSIGIVLGMIVQLVIILMNHYKKKKEEK